ncbi:MAG: TolC family protein [Elusimicrobiales bacterium]|nr:TolC family protein [Elusimicrobiales bacterium]
MKTVLFLALLALPACGLRAQDFSTATMRPITLGETCKLALARSEALAQQGEAVKQLDAAERAVAASFRPVFDANAAQSKQQNAASVTRGYLSGRYSLFSGMRDYIGARAASAQTHAASLDLERARQALYLNAAQSYLDLFSAQQEVLIRREQMDITARRVAELEARADIGRSRKSEVVAAKTQLAQDSANYLAAAGAERLAQQALLFITGLDTDLLPAGLSLTRGAPLAEYLKLALLRPDLAARRKSLDSYGYLAEIQEHSLWPTVDLSANYYVIKRPMPSPVNRWDGTVALNLPLYTGGSAGARKDSAYAAKRSAALAVQLAERQALTEVRSAYEEHKYSLLQAASLRDALALAADNAGYQQADYKLGLVTNLDVLNAMNTVLQTRLALAQAKVRCDLTLLKLETAAGLEPKQ